MDFLRPASREEALAAKAEHPTAAPIAGGTDVMVETDFGHRRPGRPLGLNRVGDLHERETGEQGVRLGASVPYGAITRSLRAGLPGLALWSSASVPKPSMNSDWMRSTRQGSVWTQSVGAR
ncbi:FAD binding domain-containing protein, partial [Streptomyces rubradiris]|uniref:FAD binding domain-containing protein n=1 Tax=Streptomyces rubradiris TaxID=285531 RepID=UPI00331B971A